MTFVKERAWAPEGSIPAVLQMFENEVRFYREIAPFLDVRVPACFAAETSASGTRLELEDLSAWRAGADPVAAAQALRRVHDQCDDAASRWPWLRRAGLAADLIGALYDREWPALSSREPNPPPAVRRLGEALLGKVEAAERAEAAISPHTLVHGDASLANMRTSTEGEICLLGWEDVRIGPGVSDLAWLLISSVEPAMWDDVIQAYGNAAHLADAMPAAAAQGVLSLAGDSANSVRGEGWIRRLTRAAELMRI